MSKPSVASFTLFLLGFVGGNLFPTLYAERLSSLSLVLVLELLNFLSSCRREERPRVNLSGDVREERKEAAERSLTGWLGRVGYFLGLLKIGFLFGFFVDAFKVGS